MFSVRFDEYFLEKQFGQHLLAQVLPKLAFMFKIPLKIGQNMKCANGRGVSMFLLLRASCCGRKDLGTSFPPISNHIIISNMVLKISSHEVAKKADF